MLSYNYNLTFIKIEVAYFMIIFSDVAGICEEERKGKTPKEEMSCASILGHTVKSRMTVIQRWMGRYRERYS